MQLPSIALAVILAAPSHPQGAKDAAPQAADSKAALHEELFAAARKGDATQVRSLLAKGADVNATWRYGLTPLMPAASRGHVEVVRVLLENGARVDVKDSFYGQTPLGSAAQAPSGAAEIVRLLLERGAKEGADGVLQAAVRGDNLELAKVVLEQAKLKPETLSQALARALSSNKTAVAEVLRKAGAVEPPKADFALPAETLARYAGSYKGETELTFAVKDGKLVGGPAGQSMVLGALDERRFRPGEMYGVTITFEVDGGRVTGVRVESGGPPQSYKKVEQP